VLILWQWQWLRGSGSGCGCGFGFLYVLRGCGSGSGCVALAVAAWQCHFHKYTPFIFNLCSIFIPFFFFDILFEKKTYPLKKKKIIYTPFFIKTHPIYIQKKNFYT
jgi:hypothetical protein